MPFKNDKISYAMPHSVYNTNKINQYAEDLKKAIELKRELVGIRFLLQQEDYEQSNTEEIKGCMPYCVMVEKATRGLASKSCLNHHKCDGGTTALGLERSTERIENGKEYFSYNLYDSPIAARRMRNGIKSLHTYESLTYGLEVKPLEKFDQQPDVIISMVNAFQTMRILQGFEYFTGKKPEIDIGAMQGMCSELTTVPYITGNLNISVLCPSTRMLCKWDQSDMGVGIPFDQFENVVKGVMATIKQ